MSGGGGFVVDYADREGHPVPGLPVRAKAVTVFQYDPEARSAPARDQGETGDLGMQYGEGVKGLRVKMDDGWHEVGWLSIENHPDEAEDVRSMDGKILRSWSSNRVTVTVDQVNPEVVEMLTGLEVKRRWDQVHPRSRVSTPTGRTPFWECAACGAESADEELFAEAGCMPR